MDSEKTTEKKRGPRRNPGQETVKKEVIAREKTAPAKTQTHSQRKNLNQVAEEAAKRKPARVQAYDKILPPLVPNKSKKRELPPEILPKKGNKKAPQMPAVIGKASVRVSFLGGLNEIGKNLTVFETGDEILLVDCGMTFPDDDMPGIDIVIPDFTYLEKNQEKIKGVVLTHGHEDHIGALPYLLKKINVPLYGSSLTLGLVEGKLKEHGLHTKASLNVIKPGSVTKLGCFTVEAIRVNHSIPDAIGFAILTPAGMIVHTGDFKIDPTPIEAEMIDLARFAELGKRGVLALFADSTNSERPGYTTSERKVGDSFDNLFRTAENKRIIIASFASNIHRVQQIINCAYKYNRKVALSGRSMENVVSIALNLGYLKVPEGIFIELDQLSQYPKNRVVLITTGSQGEPMSALSRMAYSEHRKVEVGQDDFIIISARPIPGNEKTVSHVINELMKRGCKVVYESMYEVHVSGHACQEELKILQGLVKPKFFIPVHGEQKHLVKHAELARLMGVPESNIFVGDVGSCIELTRNSLKRLPPVTAGSILVDGSGVGDVGSVVLRDRRHLSEDGLIVIVATIDKLDGSLLSGPEVVSRGFVYVRESEELIREIRLCAMRILNAESGSHYRDWNSIKTKIRDEVSRLVNEKTRRRPMILPVIQEAEV